MKPEMYEDIARRAYELYLSRGAGHGSDVDDWLEAERQVTEAAGSPRATTRRPSSSGRPPREPARRRSR
jgi:hypothetical protein